jgi:curved DNA-binding protein CbpA
MTPQTPPHDSAGNAPDHHEILGISPDATTEEIRAAYVRKVRENPPDRKPEAFEQIRDAYRYLGDPRRRAQERLLSGDPLAPTGSILEGVLPERRFVGPEAWLRGIKESST